MAQSPVINRNERTASILKVVGLYVLVGVLLSLLLLWNKGVPGQELNTLSTENKQLKSQNQTLLKVIAALDTIGDLTNQLFLLENKAIQGVSGGKLDRQRLVSQDNLSSFGREFAAMRDSITEDALHGSDGIFDKFSDMRGRMDSLMEEISTIRDVCERKIGLDSLNQAMEDLETLKEQTELKTKNANLQTEIATLTRALNSGGGGAQPAEPGLEALKAELQTLQGDLQEVYNELEGGKRLNNVLANRYETVIDVAYNKLGNAIQKLELALK